jgi:hypothetical protein
MELYIQSHESDKTLCINANAFYSQEEMHDHIKLHLDGEDYYFTEWDDLLDSFISMNSISEEFWEILNIADDYCDFLEKYKDINSLFPGSMTAERAKELIDDGIIICRKENFEDWAVATFFDIYDIPSHLEPYISFEKIVEEWRHDFYEGDTYILDSNIG